MRRMTTLAAAIALVAVAAPAQTSAADHGRPVTVVAVVDGGGFTPYHFDFLGHRHPWNVDTDPANDLDFTADPASYLHGYPGATPIPITIPTIAGMRIDTLRSGADAPAWEQFERSTPESPKMYRFPGTKVVGALNFDSDDFYGDNSAHGTRSAASAAGNIHGTCPECLFVLVNGSNPEALRWAVSQPWIDVVTNSYGHGIYGENDPARHDPTGRVPRGVVRDNIYLGSPLEATRAAAEAGMVITFSSGNGLVNAYDVPMLTYWSSEKGPDWMVTVGAVSSTGRQTALGAGKPVDISSIGESYPSTGGRSANGIGSHSGTSNASPVVGGYFAKVIQRVRELLGDTTPGHAGGVVASGTPVSCGTAVPACALGDGALTRDELEDVVFHNVLPSPAVVPDVQLYPTVPTTEHAYYYQGHGALEGRIDSAADYDAEWGRMVAVARGDLAPYERPAGERAWFVTDSRCRQKIWGSWSGGYYTGAEPPPDPVADPIATAFDAWCSRLS